MGKGCFCLPPELLCWHSSEVGLRGTQENRSRWVLRGKHPRGARPSIPFLEAFPHELGSSQWKFLLQEMICVSAVTSWGCDVFGHLMTFQGCWMGDISHLVFLPDSKCAKSETTPRKEFSKATLKSHTSWKTIKITGIFSKQRKTLKTTAPCASFIVPFTKASPFRSVQKAHGEGTLSEVWGGVWGPFCRVRGEGELWVRTRGHSCHAEPARLQHPSKAAAERSLFPAEGKTPQQPPLCQNVLLRSAEGLCNAGPAVLEGLVHEGTPWLQVGLHTGIEISWLIQLPGLPGERGVAKQEGPKHCSGGSE